MGKRILLLEKNEISLISQSGTPKRAISRVDLVRRDKKKTISMALQTDYDLILLNARLGYDGPGFREG